MAWTCKTVVKTTDTRLLHIIVTVVTVHPTATCIWSCDYLAKHSLNCIHILVY